MVKLSDALGALLRDVAYARVKSDIFSRDASLEYLKDPVLKLFPVPRVEIRNIEIDLAFAVTELKPEPVNIGAVALPVLTARLPDLVARVLSISVRRTKSSRETVPLSVRLGDAAPQFESDLAQKLVALLQADLQDLAPLIVSEPESFAKQLVELVINELRALGVAVNTEAQAEVQTFVSEWVAGLSAEIRRLVEKRQAELSVQVAVTREELADVPQNALARVKASVDIQNYDWVEYVDESGMPVQKLVPR